MVLASLRCIGVKVALPATLASVVDSANTRCVLASIICASASTALGVHRIICPSLFMVLTIKRLSTALGSTWGLSLALRRRCLVRIVPGFHRLFFFVFSSEGRGESFFSGSSRGFLILCDPIAVVLFLRLNFSNFIQFTFWRCTGNPLGSQKANTTHPRHT